jgi:GntR family transcriptional regulator
MLDRNDDVPLYLQLADLLRQQIASGRYAPGDSLPTEESLTAEHGLSRGTARQALSLLTQEKLIERYPGRGTFVSFPKLEHDAGRAIGFFTQIARDAGHTATARVLEARLLRPPAAVAQHLGATPGTRALFLHRLRFVDAEPWALEMSWFRPDIGRAMLEHDLTGSNYELIQDVLHYRIDRSENTIEATGADDEMARCLRIEVGAPVLSVGRRVFLADGSPFEYSEDVLRGDRIRMALDMSYTGAELAQPSLTLRAREAVTVP